MVLAKAIMFVSSAISRSWMSSQTTTRRNKPGQSFCTWIPVNRISWSDRRASLSLTRPPRFEAREHELQRRRQAREFQPRGCSSFHKATMFFRKAMFPRCAAEAALIPASTGTRGV